MITLGRGNGMSGLLCRVGYGFRRHYWATTAAFLGVIGTGMALALVRRVVVVGDSMRPTLDPGDRLVVVRGRMGTSGLRPGDLVTLADPRQPERTMVKRVASLSSVAVNVIGDNPPLSTDSRTFGPVERATVSGRVIFRYFPASRRSRL